MDKFCNSILNCACDYLSMLWLKLIHVSRRGPMPLLSCLPLKTIFCNHHHWSWHILVKLSAGKHLWSANAFSFGSAILYKRMISMNISRVRRGLLIRNYSRHNLSTECWCNIDFQLPVLHKSVHRQVITDCSLSVSQIQFPAVYCSLWEAFVYIVILFTSINRGVVRTIHDDNMIWKHFPHYWPFVRRPVDLLLYCWSEQTVEQTGAIDDLRRHDALATSLWHYVTEL